MNVYKFIKKKNWRIFNWLKNHVWKLHVLFLIRFFYLPFWNYLIKIYDWVSKFILFFKSGFSIFLLILTELQKPSVYLKKFIFNQLKELFKNILKWLCKSQTRLFKGFIHFISILFNTSLSDYAKISLSLSIFFVLFTLEFPSFLLFVYETNNS